MERHKGIRRLVSGKQHGYQQVGIGGNMQTDGVTTNVINGHTLEFIEDGHIYVCDGVIVPSVTQILKIRFGGKYSHVSRAVLNRAARKGTAVHQAIQDWCETGKESDLIELRNFKFLMKQYEFQVVENETPVILWRCGIPVAAGRLDLVLRDDKGRIGGGDIKRTSALDREYLAYQLNLYRLAYMQCYGIEWEFLRGIHLRDNVRKYVEIPINEKMAIELVKEYLEKEKTDD
jgi:hypothetical protein